MAIKAAKNGDSADLELFGVVGEGWSDDGITARRVKRALRELGSVATLNVAISSIGGYVDEGLEIYQMLSDHPARVIMTVGAQAISCGSLIAIAGDDIILHATSLWLAHNPWALVGGDYRGLEKASASLKIMAGAFAEAYAARTGKPQDEMQALMDEDRIMDAEEAKSWGFCTTILPSKKKPAASGASKAVARSNFEQMKTEARQRLLRAAAMTLGSRDAQEHDDEDNMDSLRVIRADARRRIAIAGL